MADFARKAEQAADNAWVKLAARISLPVLAFLGMQAWGDLREQGRSINQVLVNQAVTDAKLEDALRRINRLEETQTRKAALDLDRLGLDHLGIDPRDTTILSTAERMKRWNYP
ncbi:MAG: hypothetical protein E6Q98_18720 [Rhodospirillaceae bacterium]|nr:MAG: hypothetical protein E6Q98_18720 [Rhodospirillaceae bacterium]